ncbi:argininosuccinate lyase [Salipiger aestuarii]|uniref:Uncharacterized protein n=1 Tax=Salipiger aestuarii TaxID=568098 RepID=A0A327XWV3_9RHOB|nr:hypothetical protein [Salipiger aestuarii]EIE52515.1 hypothetical protein C357_03370 [Citreicella sp. 357]KAA8606163.1 argininosuccinate lyase [Salipiger aestuarii]KAB2540834.1 argininosuccinate lyase [Salipiger aestuarii]RAK12386.1 hypothetical protein ATI53_104324 [Salipiger aestuarii]
MKTLVALGLVCLIAGCGADGPPVPPEPKSDSGVSMTLSGTAEVGVSGGW